ncbi:copper oxidase [Nostocales cyanobacterium HT-58-2]|nr:copper oxidase [Nostocales cyanobacterium HT-58-2]
MASPLDNAYIIGTQNFKTWSQGFNQEGYLKVLPHPDVKVPFKDPFQDWREGRSGNYVSSWGPEKELNVTLKMEDLQQVDIDGLGILKSGDGKIPWLNDKATPYEFLRGYNGSVPGPLLITEPGDTLKIHLENDLTQVSNLHTHGLHVSPVGHGDNVLTAVKPGERSDISIKIPDDHFIGLDWYHPHLHGQVNEQVSSGLGGQLLILAPHDLPDLDKFDPTKESGYTFALNTFGIQQINRQGQVGDPLNQDPTKSLPAGTPLEVLDQTSDGKKIYELSDAPFMGYNGKPLIYDSTKPTGNPPNSFEYGGGQQAEPLENVIHTVNGQYNPTLELKTGEWNLFSFTNMNSNAFHVLQLVKDTGTELIPQEVTLVSLDGDASGVVPSNRREVTELPILNPGMRVSLQEWFEEPGKYYLLSNGTEEILGDNAPSMIRGKKGFDDGHLTWGPQVLATIEVTGDTVPTGSFPEPYDILTEQAQKIDEVIKAAQNGQVDRERTFTWSANAGGAIKQGNVPDSTVAKTFEGTYRINGQYFATDFTSSQVPLSMPMLGTKEIWSVKNASGAIDPNLPPGVPNIPLLEWHPFHIHQNDFTVLEVNGIPVTELKDQYLEGVLRDTIALPPTYDPDKPPTPENPYGTPKVGGNPSEVKILMNFEDYPGSYVNHCHILFHEDAGMMATVRVILNTEDTWLGLGSKHSSNGQVELFRASNLQQSINLNPYGERFAGAIDVAIGDVNYKKSFENQNVTDNVTDVITIQRSLSNPDDKFTVKVFDGQTLIDKQEQGNRELDGQDNNLLITEFTPFEGIDISPLSKASIATGDINGDGYSDIVVGIGGNGQSLIEVYSGKDFSLLSKIAPFHHEKGFDGTINLASGDVDGDNFDDIIVGQGNGGRGLVELYGGRLIESQGSLDAIDTAHKVALLSNPLQPYGDSYRGEIEVTSGYILQKPDVPNAEPVQTYHANITTSALGDVADGHEQIKVFTYTGGDHHSAATNNDSIQHEHGSGDSLIRLDKEFTPDSKLEQLSGTFADIPGLPRGESVLFALNSSGTPELIQLQEKNIPTFINISSDDILGKSDFLVDAITNDPFLNTDGHTHTEGQGSKFTEILTNFEPNIDGLGSADFGKSSNLGLGHEHEGHFHLFADHQLIGNTLGVNSNETTLFSFG